MLDDLKRILGLSSTEKFLSKEAEYTLYALVHESIEKGDKDTGIWAAAFSKAEGDEQKAKALYIELMVERLKNAIKANEEIILIGSGKGVTSVKSIKDIAWKRKSLNKFKEFSKYYKLAVNRCNHYKF